MKLIVFGIYVTLIGSLNLVISQECMTPTQVAGTCVHIKQCTPVLNLLKREGIKAADFAAKFFCRREGEDVFVCCPGKPGRKMRQNLYGPLLPPQCGFSNVTHTRIVGGVKAKLNAWPWIAALGYRNSPDAPTKWNCGGSLISARHVLTAAHCAAHPDLYIIRLGELNLESDDDGAHPIDVGLEKRIIHPKFMNQRRNDIAIIRLDREIQFTYEIHPICLPVGKIRHIDFVNANPFLAGWGRLAFFGPPSPDLMEVQIPIITTEACAKAYAIANAVIDNSHICTYAAGKDSCKGDSGGPLMLPINGSFYEIGVIMGGYRCAEPGYPGVNTRVTSFLPFIINNLQ